MTRYLNTLRVLWNHGNGKQTVPTLKSPAFSTLFQPSPCLPTQFCLIHSLRLSPTGFRWYNFYRANQRTEGEAVNNDVHFHNCSLPGVLAMAAEEANEAGQSVLATLPNNKSTSIFIWFSSTLLPQQRGKSQLEHIELMHFTCHGQTLTNA